MPQLIVYLNYFCCAFMHSIYEYACVCACAMLHPSIWRHLLLCHYFLLSALSPVRYNPPYTCTYSYYASLLAPRLLTGRFLFSYAPPLSIIAICWCEFVFIFKATTLQYYIHLYVCMLCIC